MKEKEGKEGGKIKQADYLQILSPLRMYRVYIGLSRGTPGVSAASVASQSCTKRDFPKKKSGREGGREGGGKRERERERERAAASVWL